MIITPKSGSIEQSVCPSNIYGGISVDVEINHGSEQIESYIMLEYIEFPDANYALDLSDKKYDFPINPDDGYIDGSIYFGGAHNPCDVTRLEFSTIEDGKVDVLIIGVIDFGFESVIPDYRHSFKWLVTMDIDPATRIAGNR